MPSTPAERELMEKSIRNFAQVNKGGGDIAPFQFTGTSAIWSLLGEGDKAPSDLQRFMGSPINCPNSMNHCRHRRESATVTGSPSDDRV